MAMTRTTLRHSRAVIRSLLEVLVVPTLLLNSSSSPEVDSPATSSSSSIMVVVSRYPFTHCFFCFLGLTSHNPCITLVLQYGIFFTCYISTLRHHHRIHAPQYTHLRRPKPSFFLSHSETTSSSLKSRLQAVGQTTQHTWNDNDDSLSMHKIANDVCRN